jgi:hypothetical protein
MALPQVILDIGFNGPTVGNVFTIGDPTRGVVGSVPIGDGQTWTQIDPVFIRSWSVRRGANTADDPTLRYEAGTATVILHDPDRRFDPENLAGPYVAAGRSQVEAMVRVRLRAVWNDVSYPLFFGYADDFQPDYQGDFWTYVTLTATDAQKIWAANDRGVSVAAGAGEMSGARITRILNNSGWPTADRVIATGDSALQATTLEGNELAELQLVQDSEMGEFYVDSQGRAVFRNRHAMITDVRSATSRVTFGDGGPSGDYVDVYSDVYTTGELPYADATLSTADDALANVVSITRAGGTEQVAEDTESKARYLTHAYSLSEVLLQTDAEALEYAQTIRSLYSTPTRRFARLQFNVPQPQLEGVLWPQMLGREFGDRITVKRRPKGGGDPIVRDVIIRGVEHESDGADWKTGFVLQSAARNAFFVIGDPVYGVVGSNAIAY